MMKSPILSAALFCAMTASAHAEYMVRSPDFEEGEFSVEHVGSIGHDSAASKNNEQNYVGELGYGANRFWMPVVGGEWGRDAGVGASDRFLATTVASQFHFTPEEHGFLDVGLWTEYRMAASSADTNSVKVGPLLRNTTGEFTTTANFYVEREVGSDSASHLDVSYATQIKYDWLKWLDPGIEAYGDMGYVGQNTPTSLQQERIGPVLVGEVELEHMGGLKYEVGYLQGVNGATANGTVRWKLEYGVAF